MSIRPDGTDPGARPESGQTGGDCWVSDGTATVVGDAPCVLVVGDSAAADDAMETLAARFDGASLLRERTLEGARERLADREVHCLVCPFVLANDGRSEPSGTFLERLAAGADDRPIVAVLDGDDADRTDRADCVDGTDPDCADRALAAGASDVVARDESPTVLTARVKRGRASAIPSGRGGNRSSLPIDPRERRRGRLGARRGRRHRVRDASGRVADGVHADRPRANGD